MSEVEGTPTRYWGAWRPLVWLLAIDGLFILLHFLRRFVFWPGADLFSLAREQGLPEIFQYVKLLLIIVLLLARYRQTDERGYLAWIPLFAYFLLDDALAIHERAGRLLAANIDSPRLWGLDTGEAMETAVVGVAGLLLLLLILLAHGRGSGRFRRRNRQMLLLLGVLLLFGVLLDLVFSALTVNWRAATSLAAIGDGGEMAAVSLFAAYLLRLNRSPE